MQFNTLAKWLDWQQQIHFTDIDLGLERIGQVAERLDLINHDARVITIAGTNGKGSSAAYYATCLNILGYKVGCYTSPEIIDYNERISIDSTPLTDIKIMQAFEQIEAALQGVTLTYFEFGTLAALWCFKQAKVDFIILEVGLGGRLDAANLIDADLVHFTHIGIDHTAWLGDTREEIGFEKAGVLRQNCLAVCNDPEPPKSMLREIELKTQNIVFLNQDYNLTDDYFEFKNEKTLIDLSHLSLLGAHQKLNCTGVLAGLNLLGLITKHSTPKIQQAINQTKLAGRFELIESSKSYDLYIDVGHNEDAAKVLSNQIVTLNTRCILILGMLEDKSVEQFVMNINQNVNHMVCVGIDNPRGLSAQQLYERVNKKSKSCEIASSMEHAFELAKNYLDNSESQAVKSSANKDIILAAGSFYTVESILSLNH